MDLRRILTRQVWLASALFAAVGAAWGPPVLAGPRQPVQPLLYDTSTRYRQADGSYTPERQLSHDKIEQSLLNEGRSSDKPMLIFLAGAPGAGKSSIVPVLESAGFLEPRAYVVIDSDRIKESIPEYPRFLKLDRKMSAHALHTESTDIAREALQKAIAARKNIIVDGTLRNSDSWMKTVAQVRASYPEYAIGCVFVDAELDTLIRRVAEREVRTGRNVETDYLVETRDAVRRSIGRIEPLVDVSIVIENENKPVVRHALRAGQLVASNLVLPQPGQMHRRRLLLDPPPSENGKVKVAIFDADQTLRVASSGGYFPKTASDVLLLPFVADKVAALARQGYLVMIASNQGEVSRGELPLVTADQALFLTTQMLQDRGAPVAYYDFAEGFTPDRKPGPGMAQRLEELLLEHQPKLTVDWASSIVVGDAGYTRAEAMPEGAAGVDFSDSDRRFAEKLGAKYVEARDFFGWKDYGLTGFRTKRDVADFALAHPELNIELESECELLLRH